MLGLGDQCALSVGFSGKCMNPSGPGVTLCRRCDIGRASRTVVPIVPPGTSSAPTSTASIVRAQQHSKPPQPLFTVLPSVTATGRYGIVLPSISIVWPTQACAEYSCAILRMTPAFTSHTPSAHSGE